MVVTRGAESVIGWWDAVRRRGVSTPALSSPQKRIRFARRRGGFFRDILTSVLCRTGIQLQTSGSFAWLLRRPSPQTSRPVPLNRVVEGREKAFVGRHKRGKMGGGGWYYVPKVSCLSEPMVDPRRDDFPACRLRPSVAGLAAVVWPSYVLLRLTLTLTPLLHRFGPPPAGGGTTPSTGRGTPASPRGPSPSSPSACSSCPPPRSGGRSSPTGASPARGGARTPPARACNESHRRGAPRIFRGTPSD